MTLFTLTALSQLQNAPFDTVIDARAPAEYAQDHLPGAINLPVLDDAQRAEVGTIYKQQSPFMARKLGAALVAQNVARHLQGPLAQMPGSWQPLVYCWRGGQRSGAFAMILRQIGWRVAVLEGGYKTYRRLVQAALYDSLFPAPVILLEGGTGSAKTEILARVAGLGGQVIDLEALAQHRGSLFGQDGAQPAQKLFETRLAQAMLALDPARPVLIEAESNRIGALRLPPALWHAMQSAPRVQIMAPVAARAAYSLAAYHGFTDAPERLMAAISALRPYHSVAQIEAWQAMAAAGQYAALAQSLIARHYDPRYARMRAGLPPAEVIALPDLSAPAQDHAAERLMARLGPGGACPEA
jgi:tRNA 2-selenouridine synthase